MLSGLLHHRQLSGHPLKKIFVLTPAPSCNENLCILKTVSNWQRLMNFCLYFDFVKFLQDSLPLKCKFSGQGRIEDPFQIEAQGPDPFPEILLII